MFRGTLALALVASALIASTADAASKPQPWQWKPEKVVTKLKKAASPVITYDLSPVIFEARCTPQRPRGCGQVLAVHMPLKLGRPSKRRHHRSAADAPRPPGRQREALRPHDEERLWRTRGRSAPPRTLARGRSSIKPERACPETTAAWIPRSETAPLRSTVEPVTAYGIERETAEAQRLREARLLWPEIAWRDLDFRDGPLHRQSEWQPL